MTKNTPRNRSGAHKRNISARPQNKRTFAPPGDDRCWLWGLHAVKAALANPDRIIRKGWVSRNAAQRMELDADNLPENVVLTEPREIDERLPEGSVHQGAALLCDYLEPVDLDEILITPGPIVIFDQVTDPQNVGAVIRSAAAFGMTAAVMQTRKAPPLMGALAKAAVGAVDTLSEVRVVNIARAIDALRDAGWHVVGLEGECEHELTDAFDQHGPLAIVLGAEGAGIRPAVAKACSQMAKIPMSGAMESLNVSNAAAIAFYEAQRRKNR